MDNGVRDDSKDRSRPSRAPESSGVYQIEEKKDTFRVVLINPPQVFTKTQVVAGVTPPLGLAYLAAILHQAGYEVSIIDAVGDNPTQFTHYKNLMIRGLTCDEITERIPHCTDLIGISNLYTFAFPLISDLMSGIKKDMPRIPIVLGGAHVSSLPELSLADPHVDFVVLSEGERSLLELCNALKGNGDFTRIDGFGYKKDSQLHINPKTSFIEDLDNIPFPMRELLPMESYSNTGEPHGAVRGKWTTMIATRGCPFSCTFCNTPSIWKRRWRARKPACVVQEMKELNVQYGIDDFHFEDENMSTSKKWLMEFCDELIASGLNVGWQLSNGVRAENMTPDVLRMMKKSGLTNLGIAPESGSERIRNEVINKRLSIDAVKQAVINASRLGMIITSYFIIGFPDETEAEINETIHLAKELAKLGLDECSVNTLQLVPGCELFEKQKRNGAIEVDEEFFLTFGQMGDLAGVKTWSNTLTDKQLGRLKRKAYLWFYLTSFFYHPSKIFRLIRNFLMSVQEMKSERVLHTLLKHKLHSY